MRFQTGVRRLDELLKGGLPEKSAALLHGPPFVGREILVRQFVITSLANKIPALVILTDQSASEFRKTVTAMSPSYAGHEKAGLVRIVDCFSRSIGAQENLPGVEYVDGLLNFNAVSLAVNNAERDFIRAHPNHCVVFDSLSTLIAYTNAATAFRYLQVLLGKTKAAGATSILTLSSGMHSEPEIQMIKHLVDGVVELRSDNNKNVLHVEGLGVTESRGWVDYKFSESALEITGSFAAGRIR